MIVSALLLVAVNTAMPADRAAEGVHKAKAIAALFGYASCNPDRVEPTASRGWIFRWGPYDRSELRVDARGRPVVFKIANLRSEESDAKGAKARAAALSARFHMGFPRGRWVSEYHAMPDVGPNQASKSMRFDYVPYAHGYPFLNTSLACVQFSRDLRQVREWMYHPWKIPSTRLPRHVLGRAQGMVACRSILRRAVRGRPWTFRVDARRVLLGWVGRVHPRLVFSAEYSLARPELRNRRGTGGRSTRQRGSSSGRWTLGSGGRIRARLSAELGVDPVFRRNALFGSAPGDGADAIGSRVPQARLRRIARRHRGDGIQIVVWKPGIAGPPDCVANHQI